jgi:hypothetical protein
LSTPLTVCVVVLGRYFPQLSFLHILLGDEQAPPYAFAPARIICQQMRGRFPRIKLVAGIWGFKGDTERAKARFERNQPDRLLTSLAQALEQIQELVSPHPRGLAELQSQPSMSKPEAA